MTVQPTYDSHVARCIQLPGLSVDICRFEFGSLCDVPFFDDHHVFGLSLSPQPLNSAGRYAASGMDYVPSGDVTFKPAGVTVLARNEGGVQTVVRCRMSEDRFRSIVGGDITWGAGELAAGLNITSDHIRSTLARLAVEVERPSALTRTFIEAAASVLAIDFVQFLANAGGPLYLRGGLTPHQIGRIDARIDDEHLPVPSVAELAGLLGLSERHLSRAFRISFGVSIGHRLQDVSTRRARAWLADTDLPIKLIAARLGFSSQASFTHAFGRCTSETPAAYRKRCAGAI